MRLFLFFAFALLSGPVFALKVVTTTTDLAWTAKQIGGDKVKVVSLLNGTENPHYLDASPRFVRDVANADVLCFVGLDLEIGWLPKVLSRSGNSKVQKGGTGYCETSKGIAVLEKPTGPVDRSMGDVHPAGNPHFWLSPIALGKAGLNMAKIMGGADPSNASYYKKQGVLFQKRMEHLVAKNQKKVTPLAKKSPLIEYHQEFIYFLQLYGLESFGSIEEKPGVPPSAGRIAKVAKAANQSGVKIALAATYSPRDTLEKFQEISKVPLLVVPTSVLKQGPLADYEKLHDYMVDALVERLTFTSHGE